MHKGNNYLPIMQNFSGEILITVQFQNNGSFRRIHSAGGDRKHTASSGFPVYDIPGKNLKKF